MDIEIKDSVKTLDFCPVEVKAALGDTISENIIINKFLNQIYDTLNYVFSRD